MTEPGKMITLAKQNPSMIDDLLRVPGYHISEVKLKDLRVSVAPSGFPTLDDPYMLLKQGRSELIIVAGRPSHGKSAWMFQLAFNVAGYAPAFVYSLEMDKEQIVTRLIAGKINRPIQAIQKGHVDEKTLTKAHEEISQLQYFIDDRAGLNVYQVVDSACQRAKQVKPSIVVIDYLQLLRAERGHSKDDEIGSITRTLKELAKELKVPVVVGSQLNRQCEIRGASSGDFRPLLSDLRESGNIEQDADMVIAIHREVRYTGQRPNEADVLILKNRNGPVGEVLMEYIPTQTLFKDLPQGI